MNNFVRDTNAEAEIARLEKEIKYLERKTKRQPISDEEVKNLSEYKTELFSLKLAENIIKK